jgi:plasmid replication initiation protein
MNEVVKYSNELHELKFNTLTEAQQNVFFTILQQFRNTDGYILELDFYKIFELANIAQGTNYRRDILDKLSKLQEFKFRYEINDEGDLQQDVIFPSLATDSKNRVLRIKVSKDFKDRYIDSPLKGWTRYELAEFVGLSGTYAKTIYRYLKQFRQTGLWRIKYKDFIELLGIPNSYRATNIDQQILKPAIKELSSERNLFDQRRTPFKGLIIKKIKSGRNIDALEFYFEPQPISDIERDKKENRRNLDTIASDIKRQDMLRQLKRNNLITDKAVNDFDAYIGRYLRIYNEKMNVTDILKIQSFEQSGEQIEVKLFNVDDKYSTVMRFDNFKHFKNTFERYGD